MIHLLDNGTEKSKPTYPKTKWIGLSFEQEDMTCEVVEEPKPVCRARKWLSLSSERGNVTCEKCLEERAKEGKIHKKKTRT